ncbi:MAG: beta-propeller fold lactonase family protein, partial [Planctomycetota bacterium]|nr:beta-propeller fold lactonase family protein [Planctomycetota bacterium]
MSHRTLPVFVRLATIAAAFTLGVSASQAQEAQRPERMEGALGTDQDTRSTSPVPVVEHPRLPGLQPSGLTVLHNQWSLNPAGNHVEVGDFPVNVVVHAGGQFAAVLHSGQGTHEVVMVQIKDRSVICRVVVPQSFYGICFSPDGTRLFASGGEFDVVHRWACDKDGLLSDHAAIRITPANESFVVAGLSMTSDGSKLIACGPWGGRLAITSTQGDSEPEFVMLGKGTYPYLAITAHDATRLFVTLWGGSGVAVVNMQSHAVEAIWKTPSHPTEMALAPDGELLYVACSNSNSVAVIDTDSGNTTEIISTSLYPNAANGSTPTSLALSRDGAILLVANADNNNLAVFNVSEKGRARSLGFIPTGWHPTSVRFDPRGDILVACGKGLSPRTNRHGPVPGGPPRTIR